MKDTTVVVPCFNEAERLDPSQFVRLADGAGRVLFVDDASTDATLRVLCELSASHPGLIEVEHLDHNRGKGEAVRHGIRRALDLGSPIVGYLDADLSTAVDEYLRLLSELQSDNSLDVVIGSRVALAGHRIDRRPLRHYRGRVYATAAAMALDREIYDTQCGAKLFRARLLSGSVLDEPFADRWSFDVELLGRIEADGRKSIREIPLEQWSDVEGSKLRFSESVRSLVSLARVYSRLRRMRQG